MCYLEMRYLVFVIAFCFLGCSTVELRDFDRRGASEETFAKDGAGCEMEAKRYEAQRGMGMWNVHGNYNEMFDSCMRSKGYRAK
jgi:hypothetical protein